MLDYRAAAAAAAALLFHIITRHGETQQYKDCSGPERTISNEHFLTIKNKRTCYVAIDHAFFLPSPHSFVIQLATRQRFWNLIW
jgi:hypothetical protein